MFISVCQAQEERNKIKKILFHFQAEFGEKCEEPGLKLETYTVHKLILPN